MLQDYILVHYGEIALKGDNRPFFESALIRNIKSQFEAFCPSSFEYVKKMSGGILVKLNENGQENVDKIKDALGHTFGISNYYFSQSAPQDLEEIKKICWDLLKDRDFKTFRITTNRSNKQFPLTSKEINIRVGEYVFEKFKQKKKVDLKNPDLNCIVNIVEKMALISTEKISGLGGMPVGTAGRAVVMMSGGFDSPVAAWQILKRGAQLIFVHFHSLPYTSTASLEKVESLIKVLEKYGSKTTKYFIPFADAQKEIMLGAPEKLRIILYRRLMIKISEKIAKKEKALALISGDSLGQVASQTMENILAINEAAKIPIYRPLLGMDKEEIMQLAKKIGTYEISKLPHDDCCTRLMPKKVETRAKLAEVLKAEEGFNDEKIISAILEKIKQ